MLCEECTSPSTEKAESAGIRMMSSIMVVAICASSILLRTRTVGLTVKFIHMRPKIQRKGSHGIE